MENINFNKINMGSIEIEIVPNVSMLKGKAIIVFHPDDFHLVQESMHGFTGIVEDMNFPLVVDPSANPNPVAVELAKQAYESGHGLKAIRIMRSTGMDTLAARDYCRSNFKFNLEYGTPGN